MNNCSPTGRKEASYFKQMKPLSFNFAKKQAT